MSFIRGRGAVPGALLLLGVGAALSPMQAHANGRYPSTTSVNFQPEAPERIFLGVTFGLLVSLDDGATWRWTCEGNVGYGGVWDPAYEISADGAIWANTTRGLRVSRDGGCSFTTIGAPIGESWIGDVHIAADGRIWVVTSTDGMTNDVYVSADGVTFTSAGLPDAEIYWKSVHTAPGDPGRVYVTGYRLVPEPTPVVRRRDSDTGEWVDLPFAYNGETTLLLLEVSPSDPDVVFLRINGPRGDALLRSADGAMSWSPVLVLDGDGNNLTAFSRLDAAGMAWIAGTINYGVKLSQDGGETWTDATTLPKMNCAGRRDSDGDRFACGANWNPDNFALGRGDGNTWTKVVRFSELDGQLECPAGSGHATECGPLWPGIVAQFGIGEADAGPDAGSVVDAGTIAPPPADEGCGGCQVGYAALLALLPWRRRRQRPRT